MYDGLGQRAARHLLQPGVPQSAHHRRRHPLVRCPQETSRTPARCRAPAPSSPRRRAPRRAAAPARSAAASTRAAAAAMPCGAAYGRATWPCSDATTTNTPDPCATMCGSAARAPCTAPSMSAPSPSHLVGRQLQDPAAGLRIDDTAPTRRCAPGARPPAARPLAPTPGPRSAARRPRAPDALRAPSARRRRPAHRTPRPRPRRRRCRAAAARGGNPPSALDHQLCAVSSGREVRAESFARTASRERVL